MSKEKMPSFRTAMRGYNKEDINNYIKEMSGDFIAAKREYEETVSELEQKLEASERELSELRASAEQQAAQIAEEEESRDSSEELIAALRERLDKMSEELNVLREEKLKADARAAEAERREEEARVSEAEARERIAESTDRGETDRKAELYDKVSGQIGRIMLDARENADALISEANAEAGTIRAQAQADISAAHTEALRIREGAESSARSCMEEAERKIRELCGAYGAESEGFSKKMISRYEELIEDIRVRLSSVISEMSAKANSVGALLASECAEELSRAAGDFARESGKIAEDIVGSGVTFDGSAHRAHEVADTRKKSCDECVRAKTGFFNPHDSESEHEAGERFILRDEKISLDYGAAD